MSSASCPDCSCANPAVVAIPGVEGSSGQDGQSAFTTTTAIFTVPNPTATEIILVENTDWLTVGMIIQVGTYGYFEVLAYTDTTITAEYLNIVQNTFGGSNVPVGTRVVVSGPPLEITPPLPINDSSAGTDTGIIETGVGVSTLVFYIEAASLANGDVLTNYLPGYKFQILSFDARCATPVTTGAKAATLNLEITATDVTGGVISLAGTYAQGAAQAGTPITSNFSGASSSVISIEASGVTTFMEGAFWLIIRIKNMDVADAFTVTAQRINAFVAAF